jgi:hypothetical protein
MYSNNVGLDIRDSFRKDTRGITRSKKDREKSEQHEPHTNNREAQVFGTVGKLLR